jgi:UV DNA damage endonuclease
MLRLGYICQNTTLGRKCNRTMIRKNFTLAAAQEKALANIADLEPIFEWNAAHNIHVFRLTSDLFPHFTDAALPDVQSGDYNMDFARDALRRAGEAARKYGQRLSMHPGQYNQVATPRQEVWEMTVRDLSYHAQILDEMGMGPECVICVHGGGVYGDITATKVRWIERFAELPSPVKARLAIENCERCYSVVDCLEIANACGIPLIFDCHHYECYNQIYPDRAIDITLVMTDVVKTWKGVTPLFHISEQAPDSRIGTHSEYVEKIPSYYFSVVEKGTNLDVEVEAGAKELSVFHLLSKSEKV